MRLPLPKVETRVIEQSQFSCSPLDMVRVSALIVLFSMIYVGCSTPNEVKNSKSFNATAFTQKSLVIDTHIDSPFALQHSSGSLMGGDPELEFDYPLAIKGGLDVAFMSIYVPPWREQDGSATAHADHLIDMVEEQVKRAPHKFAIATCSRDIENIVLSNKIALPMGMENGGPLANQLKLLDHFIERGIRYITLAHSENNHLSDSSYESFDRWGGLSPFGVEVVEEMNKKGILVDISHLSDKAAWQVLDLSKTPVIASHSSLRHFVPGFRRNLSDEMVVAVAERGGVIHINFGSGLVSHEARQWIDSQLKEIEVLRNRYPGEDSKIEEFRVSYTKEKPFPFANVANVADHIDRVVNLTSVDHVGIGSDFDGAGPTMPIGLENVSKIPNLVQELWNRGYTPDELRKILGGNFMRVWKEVESVALEGGYEVACSYN